MKTISLLLLALLLSMLPSCISTDPGYAGYSHYGGGYSSSYGPGYYSSGPSYYGSSYYGVGYRVCSSCRSNPCRCGHSHYGSSHNHSSSSHNHNSSGGSEKIKLIRGNDGDHGNRPDGYHTKEWYKKRGYDLKAYTYRDKDGEVTKQKKKR